MGKSLKTVTKKSIHEAKVQQLDNIGSNMEEYLQEESLTVVENILGDFIERVHDNINKEKGMVTTGKINDITIKSDPKTGTVNVLANKWLIYQDRGVNGAENKRFKTPHSYTDKMPPVEVFEEWIKEKNINTENNEKYRGDPSRFKNITKDDKIRSAAWAISKKIFSDGFRPRNIYSKEIPKLIEELKNEVADFCVQSIVQSIDVKESAQRVIIPK